jgi:hypothetical protein
MDKIEKLLNKVQEAALCAIYINCLFGLVMMLVVHICFVAFLCGASFSFYIWWSIVFVIEIYGIYSMFKNFKPCINFLYKALNKK